MRSSARFQAALLLCSLLAGGQAHASATRTHVSNNGNDANTATSCDLATPCRTFAAALSVTTPGGEILALDSSGFGKLAVDRSVSVIAAPGAFAGIGVGSSGNATGVEIATAGVNVVLRGLTITGQGGSYGVRMTNGASLTVEQCTISGFSGASSHSGVYVTTPAKVRIANSVFRDNGKGLSATGGATVSISDALFLGGPEVASDQAAVWAYGSAGSTTTVTVSDSLVAKTPMGIVAYSIPATAKARIAITRTAITQNSFIGVLSQAQGAGSVAEVSISDSMVAGVGGYAFRRIPDSGTAILQSRGDNLVAENVNNGDPPTALPPI